MNLRTTTIALLFAAAFAADIEQVEIVQDPPTGGKQVLTVRMRPGKTQTMDRVAFECVYRQEYKWRQPGTTNVETRVNEPEFFTYRQKDVKLVEDLDCYISFRVPMGLKVLQGIYGDTTFATNALITVSKIKISGLDAQNATVWRFETEAQGVHTPVMEEVAHEQPAESPVPAQP